MLSAALVGGDGLAALASLFTAPQGERWRMSLRMPAGPAAALAPLGDPAHVVAVSEAGRPVAVGVRAVKAVRWHGEPRRLGYLALLRRAPDLPAAAAAPALRLAFAALAATRRGDELPFDLTAIALGNRRAERLLAAGLPGVPDYRPRAVYRVRAWRRSALARLRARLRLRPLAAGEPAPLVDAAPVLAPEPSPLPLLVAEEDGRVVACGRLDDQRAVRGLAIALPPLPALARPLLNLARAARRLPAIPAPGTTLPQAFLADWRWLPGRADAALAIAAAAAASAPAEVGTICAGWCDDHPDAPALAAAAPPAETVAARWFAVGAEPGPGIWHLDAGGL